MGHAYQVGSQGEALNHSPIKKLYQTLVPSDVPPVTCTSHQGRLVPFHIQNYHFEALSGSKLNQEFRSEF